MKKPTRTQTVTSLVRTLRATERALETVSTQRDEARAERDEVLALLPSEMREPIEAMFSNRAKYAKTQESKS